MSGHILPRNCLEDSSEFQNLFWLGPCSYCIHFLFESRTNLNLVPNWKALILIHKQQTLNVSQTRHRTMFNQRFCDYIRKINIILSNVILLGEGEIIGRKQDDLPNILFDINYSPGVNFKNEKASTALCLVCTSCSLCKVRPCQSSDEKLSEQVVWSIWELRMPGSPQISFEVGWLWCLSRRDLWMKLFTSWQY